MTWWLWVIVIIVGVIALLFLVAWIYLVNELVKNAMEDGETGWDDR